MAVNIPILVPLAPSLRKRFYEPVVLLFCLIFVHFKNNTTEAPDLDTDASKSPKSAFHCFVNKLGQLCDSKRGGDTITAFGVLRPGNIEYRFASNNRDTAALEQVKRYITGILKTLAKTTSSKPGNKDEMHSQILRKALVFNRPRIEFYIKTFTDNCKFCIDMCQTEETDEGVAASDNLRIVKRLAVSASEACIEDIEFALRVEKLLVEINRFHNSPSEEFIRSKARVDRDNVATPWSVLRHAAGRLLSYFIAVKVLISTSKRWPELFDDFEVTYVHSSGPGDTPSIRRTASGIIGHMSSDPVTLEDYKQKLKEPQFSELDGKIKKSASKSEFQPIVHAEITLLYSILKDTREAGEPLRFFEESNFGKYIGCSKPTCRLCWDFFQHHPEGVQVRASHQNLYYNWRLPDVFDHFADKERQVILEQMIKPIRDATFRAISDRVMRKKNDSRTTPSDPLVSTKDDGDDLASRMGQMDIASERDLDEDSSFERGSWTEVEERTFTSSPGSSSLEELVDDEDDDGGAIL
ncbi:hypothetical protein QBC46DRAFT_389041 [Diplogelasinospora grovesii]|uniref:Uncharacterized protein n=1 Tax=Diplogelasinospora grovesii TaxID=303347 RepID=A0AAN6N674_9PEZI|nr:hypothetical protein QBC46DRAFT_389041 [Diplogelasinospora grovesii]